VLYAEIRPPVGTDATGNIPVHTENEGDAVVVSGTVRNTNSPDQTHSKTNTRRKAEGKIPQEQENFGPG